MGTVGKPTTEEGAQPLFCQGREGVGVCPGRGSQLWGSAGRAELTWPGTEEGCERGGKERCLWQGSGVQHRAAVKGETGRG